MCQSLFFVLQCMNVCGAGDIMSLHLKTQLIAFAFFTDFLVGHSRPHCQEKHKSIKKYRSVNQNLNTQKWDGLV